MDEQLEILRSALGMMEEAIPKRDRQLFNAFSLSHQELLQKAPPYDFEYIRSVTEALYEYCNQLEIWESMSFLLDSCYPDTL